MKEEWNKGYEKGRDDYCCNGNCNQGRDCPLRKMNNESVAWMYEKSNGASKLSFVKEKMLWEDMLEIPLYAHPAKTLTDEEIEDLIDSEIPMILLGGRLFYRQFARAILKKASEK